MDVYQFQKVIKILTSARSNAITILNWKYNPLKVRFEIFCTDDKRMILGQPKLKPEQKGKKE